MPMKIGTERPSFNGATDWINGEQADVESDLKGNITLIHFWSVSCGICKENLPRIEDWREKFRDQGLRLVAVHMPRYPADLDPVPVKEAIAQYNITEPCAIDNGHMLRDAFQNEQGYVPAYYLFDGAGKLRSFAAGERGLNMVFSALNRLLEKASSL
jgi:thiol-disulfide isomerase/thioredoxin